MPIICCLDQWRWELPGDAILNSPATAQLLSGKTLAEAFRLCIVQHPRLKAAACDLSHIPLGANLWLDVIHPDRQVDFLRINKVYIRSTEEHTLLAISRLDAGLAWEYGDRQSKRYFDKLAAANGSEDPPLKNCYLSGLSFIRSVSEEFDRFFDLFRHGIVMAKSRNLIVPPSCWEGQDARVDFRNNDLFLDGKIAEFKSISLMAPLPASDEHAQRSLAQDVPPAQRGRPPEYPWDHVLDIFFASCVEGEPPTSRAAAKKQIRKLMIHRELGDPSDEQIDRTMKKKIPDT